MWEHPVWWDSFLAILAAIDFTWEHLGVELERTVPVCTYSSRNNQCIGKRCSFSAAGRNKPKVAFLCVHNSCRSQMAEALDKQLAGDVFESFSAGIEPSVRIDPDAVRLMKRVHGIDMEQTQHSKPFIRSAAGGYRGHHGLQRPIPDPALFPSGGLGIRRSQRKGRPGVSHRYGPDQEKDSGSEAPHPTDSLG